MQCETITGLIYTRERKRFPQRAEAIPTNGQPFVNSCGKNVVLGVDGKQYAAKHWCRI